MARGTRTAIDLALDVSQIQHLCSLPGPWLTILLPAYRKGEQQIPDSVRLKSLLRTATGPNIPGGVPAPVRELAESEALLQGGKGIALFSAPGFTGGYRVDSALGDKLVFAEYPFVKPLLSEAFTPHEVFALGLSRKHMRLFHYSFGACEELAFPKGIATGMQEAL